VGLTPNRVTIMCIKYLGECTSELFWYNTNVTYHDFARTYHGLISSYITLLTYFCVHGTIPTSTHCTASAIVGREFVGHYISFPRVQISHNGKEILPVRCSAKILFDTKNTYMSCLN